MRPLKRAKGQAQSKTINAEADANVITIVGNAEAAKVKAVGTSEADVIKLKIASMDPSNYAAIEVARQLATGDKKWVPDIIAGGGGEGGNSLIQILLAKMIQADGHTNGNGHAPAAPQPAPAAEPPQHQ